MKTKFTNNTASSISTYLKLSLMFLLGIFSAGSAFSQAPANDLICGATPIIGCSSTFTSIAGTTTGATTTGETGLTFCGTTGGTAPGVWYAFTGWTVGNTLTMNTCTTGVYDTKIHIYSSSDGTCTGTLSCIVGNDDFCGAQSSVSWAATAVPGGVYYVYVHGFLANSGAFTLSYNCVVPPPTVVLSNLGNPGNGPIAQGATDAVLRGFTLTPNATATSVNFTSVTLSRTGTATTTDISNIRVVYDANGNGIVDGAETSVSGAGVALASPTTFTITGQTGFSNERRYLLVGSVAPGAVFGRTYIASSLAASGVVVSGATVTGSAAGSTRTITGAPPANDNCSAAVLIACNSSTSGSILGATNDAPVPPLCGLFSPGNFGVWYTFIGDGSLANLTTCDPSGVGFDTKLQVFTGTCGSFTCVASNDDMSPACATGTNRSRVTFTSVPATQYYVLVSAFSSTTPTTPAASNFILNFTCQFCTTPTPTGASSITANSALANFTCSGCTGTIIVEYGLNGFIPGIGATAGVGGTVISGAVSPQLISGLTPNTAYQYYVRQNCSGAVPFSTNSSATNFTTAPANDLCPNASPIACGGTVTGNTSTANPDANTCGGSPSPGVWYTFNNPTAVGVTLSLCGSAYDTRLSVYTGPCNALVLVPGACNDDFCGLQSQVVFFANAGTTYTILVNGFSSAANAGAFTMTATCVPPPINDDPCILDTDNTGAYALGSIGTTATVVAFNNSFATAGIGEMGAPVGTVTYNNVPTGNSCNAINGWCADDAGALGVQNSLWYSFVSPASGNIEILTTGGDAQIALWEVPSNCTDYADFVYAGYGNDDGNGRTVGSKLGNNCIGFQVTGSQIYYLQLDGRLGARFSGTLSLRDPGPPQGIPSNDLCSGALPISVPGSVSGSTVCANFEASTPACTTSNSANSVWYSFIGDGSRVTLSTCDQNTNFDTKVSVYTGSCTTLNCVAGNDDQGATNCPSAGFGIPGFTSRVEFCTQIGVEYFVMVHGFGTANGNFTVNATSTPGPSAASTQSSYCNGRYNVSCNGASDGSITFNTGSASPCPPFTNTPPSNACFNNTSTFSPWGTFTCGGTTSIGASWAGEYSLVNVVAGGIYQFNSTFPADLISIVDNPGGNTVPATIAYATGIGSATWQATFTGQVRFFTHNAGCIGDQVSRVRSINCICDPTGGGPTYTYSIDGGANFQTSPAFTGLSAGTYDLVIQDDEGCQGSATVTLTQPPFPTISCPAPVTVNCIANIPPPNVSQPSTNASELCSSTVTHEGDVSVGQGCSNAPATITRTYKITDNCGNTASCTQIITRQATPLVVTVCPNQNVAIGYEPLQCARITSATTGGCGAYTYVWNNVGNSTTPDITVCPAVTTTYCVTVTDENGCTSQACHTVTVVDLRCSSHNASGTHASHDCSHMGGSKATKVLMCKPSSHNPSHGGSNSHGSHPSHGAQEKCVKRSDVASKMAQGWTLGPCGGTNFSGGTCGEAPGPVTPNCTCKGKITSVTLTYVGAGPVSVNVYKNSNHTNLIASYPVVVTGQQITFGAPAGLPSKVYISVSGQTCDTRLNTKCKDLVVGSRVRSFDVTAWSDNNGNTCNGASTPLKADATTEGGLGDPTVLSAYPNPFNEATTVEFTVAENQHVKVEVFSMTGTHTEVLFDGDAEGGAAYKLAFKPETAASGIYFARMTTSTGVVKTEKLVLQK